MAKGKYADITPNLPRTWGSEIDDDPGYLQRIEAVKTQILDGAKDEGPPEDPAEIIKEVRGAIAKARRILQQRIAPDRRWGSEYAKAWREARLAKEAVEEEVSEMTVLLRAYEQLMAEQYEVEDVQQIKLEDGGSVAVQWEPTAKIEDKEKFRLWCIAEGLENEMALPWQTANALTKKALLEGRQEPDGITAKARPKFVLRKA